jgi:hypothetical protein
MCKCVTVFYPLAMQRTILRALVWLLSELPDGGTYEMPKHVGDLLTSDVYVYWLM